VCDKLGLRAIGIPTTDLNVCEGLKKLTSLVATGLKKFIEPFLRIIKAIVTTIMDAVFSALGAIFQIKGEINLSVEIEGKNAGMLQLGDAQSMGALQEMAILEANKMSATTLQRGDAIITLKFSMSLGFFGLSVPFSASIKKRMDCCVTRGAEAGTLGCPLCAGSNAVVDSETMERSASSLDRTGGVQVDHHALDVRVVRVVDGADVAAVPDAVAVRPRVVTHTKKAGARCAILNADPATTRSDAASVVPVVKVG